MNDEATTRGKQPEREEEEQVAVLDFDMLCATVALSADRRGKAPVEADQKGWAGGGVGGGGGGVQRMWEGDVLACLDDRVVALETACCPWYRFGRNMRRANLGSCLVQGSVYFLLSVAALASLICFSITIHHIYLFLGVGSLLLLGIYAGYFRTRTRKQFNIGHSDAPVDDCVLHLVCPCCTLCQEARTLEMNNVQCGIWHGRGDTLCLGNTRALYNLHECPSRPIKPPDAVSMGETSDSDHSWSGDAKHVEPLVPPADQPE